MIEVRWVWRWKRGRSGGKEEKRGAHLRQGQWQNKGEGNTRDESEMGAIGSEWIDTARCHFQLSLHVHRVCVQE